MRGTLARDLIILALGLVLGYFFAMNGGGKLMSGIVGHVPQINLSRPAVVLLLIGVVVLTLIFTSRGRK